jgi:hypothetical protein
MLARLIAKATNSPHDRRMWCVLAVLIVAQVIAFWMLCSHQVRKAEMRNADLQVERIALADCLQYVPRSTMSSCTTRAVAHADDAAINSAAVVNQVALSYVR